MGEGELREPPTKRQKTALDVPAPSGDGDQESEVAESKQEIPVVQVTSECDPKPSTWEDCQRYIVDNAITEEGIAGLIRLGSVDKLYEKEREETKASYVSYADFIKHNKLQFEVEPASADSSKLKAFDRKEHFCALLRNEFGYHINSDIMHYVLWSTKKEDAAKVKEMVTARHPGNEYLWWRNPARRQSVPDVFHLQVLVRVKDDEGNRDI